jgi:HlyD family secretion protein
VTSAAAQLEQLLRDPSEAEVREVEINVEKAQLELEKAKADLARAQLYAPIDGTVLSVTVEEGYRAAVGQPAATLANLNELELTVNVAEVDISKIQPGQPVEITVDALPDDAFRGTVTRIAPVSSSEQGVVNYPVTVQLTGSDLTGARPGMTAVATFLGDESETGWLVPTNALNERGNGTVVMIMRDRQPTPIAVTVEGSQGEWTIVQSTELQDGDEAMGTVSSFLDQNNTPAGFGGPFRRRD